MNLEKQPLSKHVRRTTSAISLTSTYAQYRPVGRLVTHPKVLLKFGRHFDLIHPLLLGKSKTHVLSGNVELQGETLGTGTSLSRETLGMRTSLSRETLGMRTSLSGETLGMRTSLSRETLGTGTSLSLQ